jgi:hypothetical protein
MLSNSVFVRLIIPIHRLDYLLILLWDVFIFGGLYLFFIFRTEYLKINEIKAMFKAMKTQVIISNG